MAGGQPPVGGDHPPPRETFPAGQDVPDRSGGARVPGLLGDLAVGDHLAGTQRPEPRDHRALEPFHGAQGIEVVVFPGSV
jgi:hypothetical protein